jgi:hypothetical protein
MAKYDKSIDKMKEIIKKNKENMGMLLLPSQWNLTINKESQLY